MEHKGKLLATKPVGLSESLNKKKSLTITKYLLLLSNPCLIRHFLELPLPLILRSNHLTYGLHSYTATLIKKSLSNNPMTKKMVQLAFINSIKCSTGWNKPFKSGFLPLLSSQKNLGSYRYQVTLQFSLKKISLLQSMLMTCWL